MRFRSGRNGLQQLLYDGLLGSPDTPSDSDQEVPARTKSSDQFVAESQEKSILCTESSFVVREVKISKKVEDRQYVNHACIRLDMVIHDGCTNLRHVSEVNKPSYRARRQYFGFRAEQTDNCLFSGRSSAGRHASCYGCVCVCRLGKEGEKTKNGWVGWKDKEPVICFMQFWTLMPVCKIVLSCI